MTESDRLPLPLFRDRIETPIGGFALVADADGRLHATGFLGEGARTARWLEAFCARAPSIEDTRDPGGLSTALARYFHGDLAAIDGLPVVTGGTDFQRAVWRALREIPCGETWSYGQLARHIGRPSAVRAVGLANGANPVSIVVPCHRVIGADGTLTGYGGGMERKRWLLAHEGAAEPSRQLALPGGAPARAPASGALAEARSRDIRQ